MMNDFDIAAFDDDMWGEEDDLEEEGGVGGLVSGLLRSRRQPKAATHNVPQANSAAQETAPPHAPQFQVGASDLQTMMMMVEMMKCGSE